MRSATDFLPLCIMALMNLETSTLPNFGSGRISRLGTSRRRGILTSIDHSSVEKPELGYPIPALLTAKTRPLTQATQRAGSLRTLGTVLRTGLLTILDTLGIQRAANGVIAHTRQILDTTTTDQDNRVFLQVVAFTADIGDDFKAIGQTNFTNLTQGGVRLFRSRGVHTGANAALLRALFQSRNLALGLLGHSWLAHELVDGRHIKLPSIADP